MAPSPFATALARLLQPLEFAARSDFAHLDRVQNLDESVAGAAAALRELAIPRDISKLLERMERTFGAGIEPAKRERAVQSALDRLRPMADPLFSENALASPLTGLGGIGPKRADTLARRGLSCVGDLLLHLPTRYDDRRALSVIKELEIGRRATFTGHVTASSFAPSRTRGGRFRRVFEAVVSDDSDSVTLRWFQGGETLSEMYPKGSRVLVTGDVKRYRFNKVLIHPEVERLRGDEDGDCAQLQGIVADYSAPETLNPRALRRIIGQALAEYADLVQGFFSDAPAEYGDLPEPAQALRMVHTPPPDADLERLRERRHPAHVRLVLEELFVLTLGLALRKAERASTPGLPFVTDGERVQRGLAELPFTLTGAQRRVWDQICADVREPHPMNRLLQGDVGSGKTAVAFLAALAAADSGYQAALMAPTELLAEQHARTLRRLSRTGKSDELLRVALLVSSLSRSEESRVRRELAAGRVDLVVGTHALVQEQLSFARLGMAIVDEQHRFGVLQRQALAAKTVGDAVPHVLVMTATPIPRTLSMTLYGDLDLSIIDELPPGRSPVETGVLRSGEGPRIVEAIRETVARGEQVYVVYPLVEESEKVDLRSAQDSAEKIQATFSDCVVDLIHGRLDSQARNVAMARFESGKTQILVCTTVIEVGVDVANATLMIVEHAERFGLAQLHQLRGRVGRGKRPGTCLLIARGQTEESEARLRAMADTTDGFKIADADLRIRGPGEFLGTRQSGRLPDLKVADLVRDARLVAVAREAALARVRREPGLRDSPDLARAVAARWGDRLALTQVG